MKAMHQNYFVINYWGECWSSANYYDLDMVRSGKIGDSCRGPEPNDICSDHTNFECTGKDPYSYLYEIVNPIGKTIIDSQLKADKAGIRLFL